MYRKVQFAFLVLYFLISVVYNESLYYCNSFMLEQISYLGKFWFLRYGPKCSWPIRLQDFTINHRTLKLAVSHNCVTPTVFSEIAHQVFLIFDTMVGNSNIEKLTEPFFQGKFIFGPNLGKRAPNGPKIGFLEFFEKFCDVSFFLEIIYNEN